MTENSWHRYEQKSGPIYLYWFKSKTPKKNENGPNHGRPHTGGNGVS